MKFNSKASKFNNKCEFDSKLSGVGGQQKIQFQDFENENQNQQLNNGQDYFTKCENNSKFLNDIKNELSVINSKNKLHFNLFQVNTSSCNYQYEFRNQNQQGSTILSYSFGNLSQPIPCNNQLIDYENSGNTNLEHQKINQTTSNLFSHNHYDEFERNQNKKLKNYMPIFSKDVSCRKVFQKSLNDKEIDQKVKSKNNNVNNEQIIKNKQEMDIKQKQVKIQIQKQKQYIPKFQKIKNTKQNAKNNKLQRNNSHNENSNQNIFQATKEQYYQSLCQFYQDQISSPYFQYSIQERLQQQQEENLLEITFTLNDKNIKFQINECQQQVLGFENQIEIDKLRSKIDEQKERQIQRVQGRGWDIQKQLLKIGLDFQYLDESFLSQTTKQQNLQTYSSERTQKLHKILPEISQIQMQKTNHQLDFVLKLNSKKTESENQLQNYSTQSLKLTKQVQVIIFPFISSQLDMKTQFLKKLQTKYQVKLQDQIQHFNNLLKDMHIQISQLQIQKQNLSEELYQLHKEIFQFKKTQIPKKQQIKSLQIQNQKLQQRLYELQQKVIHSQQQIQVFQTKYGSLIEQYEKNKTNQWGSRSEEISNRGSPLRSGDNFENIHLQKIQSSTQTSVNIFCLIKEQNKQYAKAIFVSKQQKITYLEDIIKKIKQELNIKELTIQKLQNKIKQYQVDLKRQKQFGKQILHKIEKYSSQISQLGLKQNAMANEIKVLKYELHQALLKKCEIINSHSNNYNFQNNQKQFQSKVIQFDVHSSAFSTFQKQDHNVRQNSYLNNYLQRKLNRALIKKHQQAIMMSPKVQKIKQKNQFQSQLKKRHQTSLQKKFLQIESIQKKIVGPSSHSLLRRKLAKNYQQQSPLCTPASPPISPPSSFSQAMIQYAKKFKNNDVGQRLQRLRFQVRKQLMSGKI